MPTSAVGVSTPEKKAVCVAWATVCSPERNLQRHERLNDVEFVVDAEAEHAIAGDGDDFVVGVGLQLAVARVEALALRALHDQEAVALDGHVERIGADFDRALREVRIDRGHLDAQADLPRVGAAARVDWRRADALRLQELRGEQHVRFLEADRVGVGDVVAHDVDRRFGGLQAGERRRHCRLKTHVFLLPEESKLDVGC